MSDGLIFFTVYVRRKKWTWRDHEIIGTRGGQWKPERWRRARERILCSRLWACLE